MKTTLRLRGKAPVRGPTRAKYGMYALEFICIGSLGTYLFICSLFQELL